MPLCCATTSRGWASRRSSVSGPDKIWRGSVAVGHDRQLVYGKVLRLSEKEIEKLKAGA
jgi:hypothetical protein